MREENWYAGYYKLCLDLPARKNDGSCPAYTSSFLFCENQIVGRWEGRRKDSWCVPAFVPVGSWEVRVCNWKVENSPHILHLDMRPQ